MDDVHHCIRCGNAILELPKDTYEGEYTIDCSVLLAIMGHTAGSNDMICAGCALSLYHLHVFK